MIIASWNVNSVRLRVDMIVAWLKARKPDIVCLQELKCQTEQFPNDAFADMGYNIACWGQKSYNGVALLSKTPLEDIHRGVLGDAEEAARYIEALTMIDGHPVRVGGLYAPNGNPAPGPKYDDKLRWYAAFETRIVELLEYEEPLVLAGDYNIIPTAADVYDPKSWEADALFRPESRAVWRRLCHLGLSDAIAFAYHGEQPAYTFWDYQGGAWRKNHGIRIDHLLLSPQASDKVKQAGIDKSWRGEDKPSDHVPVWVELH